VTVAASILRGPREDGSHPRAHTGPSEVLCRLGDAKRPPEGSGEKTLPPLERHLVAHSDSFWHLFVGTEGRPHELLSVPDSEVLSVCTLGEGQPDEENRRMIAAPTDRTPEVESPTPDTRESPLQAQEEEPGSTPTEPRPRSETAASQRAWWRIFGS
jgi:hypothetical protein